MDTLSDFMSFGDKFMRFKTKYAYGDDEFINLGRLSYQAIDSLNYLQPFLMKGIMPNSSHETLGLYSYIVDREEFEEDMWEGFISLEKYEECHLYEYYHNKYDNITIYVYDCSSTSAKKLNCINKNKCLFL